MDNYGFQYYLSNCANDDYFNKERIINDFIGYFAAKTQSMFKYENLPDTIPQRELEMLLQFNGFAVITKADNGKLYAFRAGLGGIPNEYYLPTQAIVNNPYLKFNKICDVNKDCIIIRNDSCYKGLFPLFHKFAALMAENEITLRMDLINTRIPQILTVGDDRTKAAADIYLRDIKDGNLKTILVKGVDFIDNLKVNPYAAASMRGSLTELIETEQYLKASFYNELGLNANFNMKREAINSEEAQLNDDALLPLIDNMLSERREGIKKVNEMFGTDISVDFYSAWEDNKIELEAEQKQMKKGGENNGD